MDREERILQIIEQEPKANYHRIAREEGDYFLLKELSPIRTNVISWLPFQNEEQVLELNAGYGALTGAMTSKVKKITCVTENEQAATIIRRRHENQGTQIECRWGDNALQKHSMADRGYDWIIIKNLKELAQVRELLANQGKVILICRNALGMMYFAGVKDEKAKDYFASLMATDADFDTCTREEIKTEVKKAGLRVDSWYYPYPDEMFPMEIFSDEYLPHVGQLTSNDRNFQMDRIKLFEEAKVFDRVIKEKQFPQFSNAYLLILQKGEFSHE